MEPRLWLKRFLPPGTELIRLALKPLSCSTPPPPPSLPSQAEKESKTHNGRVALIESGAPFCTQPFICHKCFITNFINTLTGSLRTEKK